MHLPLQTPHTTLKRNDLNPLRRALFLLKEYTMRKIFSLLTGLILFATITVAQKPVAEKAIQLFAGKEVTSYALFTPGVEAKEDIAQYVDGAYMLNLKADALDALRTANAGLVRLQLPYPLNLQLDLFRTDVFSDEATISTTDGRTFAPNPNHQFYRGIISGNPNSLAIVSIFEERVQILFADDQGNMRIQQTAGNKYVLFADKDILIPKQLECYVDDETDFNAPEDSKGSSNRTMTGNCIEVYVECDYKSYLDNGSSVPNTEEWVAELWNEVITLYENEDIPVAVSDVLVYTSSDPFAALNSTSAVLTAFRAHIDTLVYDGRLAHFLSTRSLGGGIAYLNVLCSNSHQVAVSASLSTNIVPFPTYSWSVEVVTHEMGHNVGSPHTHNCSWNGNGTQVDDCGNVWATNNNQTPEGAACYDVNNPILPPSGTIMSYCHLIAGVGINFNNGFGTAPGDLIRDKYLTAPCNTGTCTPPLCTTLTLPDPGSTGVDINQDLFWASADGAEGYRLTIGTTPTNGSILNNADVGLVTTYNPVNSLPFSTTIYVKIVPYNSVGDATGCVNQSFTTEANVAPECTQLTFPVNGATDVSADVVLTWAHSVGNQTGYKISIGTSLNGTQILNLFNVGNVTTYDHPTSYPYGTTLYVKITPYWTGGDINGCASQSFTTIEPMDGDFCTNAITLPCGGAIEGSTLNAMSDTGMPFCGTAVEAPGIWYTFVGDGSNTIVSLCSDYDYDTQINAYSGSCSSLVCVTGIDDFCYTGSMISFPTTAGTNYFVLVQGWGGEQGNFTITRECYDGPFYCLSSGRYAGSEWISNVTFAGQANASGSASYSDFTDEPIEVSRGGTYALQIAPGFQQGTRVEYYKVWIDYNHDGDFTDSGEQVFSAGPTTAPVSGNITIPVTATKAMTRMRVSMRYNATPSSSCGTFANGEVEDYMLNIKCNMVTSTLDDAGNGTLRNVSACVDAGDNILFASSLNGQTLNVTSSQISVVDELKWMANAGANIQIQAVGINRILKIPIGTSMEVQNLKFVGGTATDGSAIDNLGTLILRDCDIHPAVGSNSIPLRNRGNMNVFGICDIRF